MAKLRTLIVDDEPLARRRLRRLLRASPGVEVVGECGDGTAAVTAVGTAAPDLLLLDVQMPELDGFGVLDALPPDGRPAVVFVTAYDAHAVRAFEVHALDYLLKPVDGERLAVAVQRAELHVRSARLGGGSHAQAVAALLAEVAARRGRPGHVLVRDGDRSVPVRLDEIDWIEARGKYVRLHVGAATYLHREGLERFATWLDPAQFLRIHRSTIVNARCVTELEPAFHGDYVVALRDGSRLAMSRGYGGAVRRFFGGLV